MTSRRRGPQALEAGGGGLYSDAMAPAGGFDFAPAPVRKVPYYSAPHTTLHTTLHLNKNREALRQRKLPAGADGVAVRTRGGHN
jgi:hypothetical protein